MVTRRSALLSLFFSPFLQGSFRIDKDHLLTLEDVNKPRPFRWNLDGVSAFEVVYKGETVSFTPEEVMAALRPPLHLPDGSVPTEPHDDSVPHPATRPQLQLNRLSEPVGRLVIKCGCEDYLTCAHPWPSLWPSVVRPDPRIVAMRYLKEWDIS